MGCSDINGRLSLKDLFKKIWWTAKPSARFQRIGFVFSKRLITAKVDIVNRNPMILLNKILEIAKIVLILGDAAITI